MTQSAFDRGRYAHWALPAVGKPFVSRGAAERLADIVRALDWDAGAARDALLSEAALILNALTARVDVLRFRADHPAHPVAYAEAP